MSNPDSSAQVYGKSITGADVAIGATTPTPATQALTFSGNAAAGETFTVGPITYTWTATAAVISGQTGNYVLVGVDAATSIVNGTAALIGTASKGTLFSNGTIPNPAVTAVATSATVLTVTAIQLGADGNGIPTTETMGSASWGAATTTGGVSASLNVAASITPGGTQNVNLIQVGGATFALGQQLAAASIPVVLPVAQIASLTAGATSGVVTVIPTTGQAAGTASLAARATRTGVLIRNLSTSTETCWFGYSGGVTATTGMQLSVGESVSVQNAAQIFFFSVSGTATINCAEDYN
jgi:hypothetical protein